MRRKPPKSSGREQFGADFVADLLTKGLDTPDLVATVTAFTASSIADAIERFVAPVMKVDQVIVSGGGARNPLIMSGLKDLLPGTEIVTSNCSRPLLAELMELPYLHQKPPKSSGREQFGRRQPQFLTLGTSARRYSKSQTPPPTPPASAK